MSKVSDCPTCGGKAKVREDGGVVTYVAIQDEEVLKKVGQLKKAMIRFKEKSDRLEKELALLKTGIEEA